MGRLVAGGIGRGRAVYWKLRLFDGGWERGEVVFKIPHIVVGVMVVAQRSRQQRGLCCCVLTVFRIIKFGSLA